MFLMAYSQGLDKEFDEELIFFMLSPVLTMFAMDIYNGYRIHLYI